jgi:hypothetical protein
MSRNTMIVLMYGRHRLPDLFTLCTEFDILTTVTMKSMHGCNAVGISPSTFRWNVLLTPSNPN